MEKIALVYDTKLKAPACPLLQAAMGGDSHYVSLWFDSKYWLLTPTKNMQLIAGTEEEWKKAAQITKDHWGDRKPQEEEE